MSHNLPFCELRPRQCPLRAKSGHRGEPAFPFTNAVFALPCSSFAAFCRPRRECPLGVRIRNGRTRRLMSTRSRLSQTADLFDRLAWSLLEIASRYGEIIFNRSHDIDQILT